MEDTQIIRLNSSEALSESSSSNLKFNFGNTAFLSRCIGMRVISGSFMNQTPNLNSINANLTLTYDYNGGGDATIVLTEGQYTLSEIMSLLQSNLRTDTGNVNITVTQEAYTDKVIVATNDANTIKIKTGSLGSSIGFSSDSSDATSVTANTISELGGLQILYIHSSNVAPRNGLYGSANLNSNLVNHLFGVPVNVPYGSRQTFNNDTGYVLDFIDIKDLRQIELTLRDGDGNELTNWSSLHPFIMFIEVKYYSE